MWVLGLIVYYAFFRLTFASYGYHAITRFHNAPPIYLRPWFQLVILSAGLFLFGLSLYLFFASGPWLSLVPFILLAPSFGWLGHKRNSELHRIIGQCALMSERLKREGLSQSEMNRRIVTQVLGNEAYYDYQGWWLDSRNLSDVVGYILVCKGLESAEDAMADFRKQSENPGYVTFQEKVDAMLKEYQSRFRD